MQKGREVVTEGGDVNRKKFPEQVLALLENILGKVP